MFVDAMKAVEAAVRRATEKLAHDVDAQAADLLAETLRRVVCVGWTHCHHRRARLPARLP